MGFDVIIVGAGSMGISAGYYLSKIGKRVLLIDSFDPPHDQGSHHGETRIIRHAYGEGGDYVPLALRAQELWGQLEEESGEKLFYQTGFLSTGEPSSSYLKGVVNSAEKYRLPLEFIDAKEIHERWPGISVPDYFIGLYEPQSGVLKSEEAIRTYRKLAVKNGATIVSNKRVRHIHVKSNEVRVDTKKESFYAKSLIITSGAWSSGLLSEVGLNLPLQPVRKTIGWFKAEEELYSSSVFPAFSFSLSGREYYGFPSFDGTGLKVGRHDGGEPIDADDYLASFGVRKEDEKDLRDFLQQYLPKANGPLNYGRVGKYTLTPDRDFVIDLHPTYKNVAIAAGFSGHGFKFSSVVGEILTQLITEGSSEYALSLFSIDRFQYNAIKD